MPCDGFEVGEAFGASACICVMSYVYDVMKSGRRWALPALRKEEVIYKR